MTTRVLKHICDRCGKSEEFDIESQLSHETYPKDWQHVELGQTGATLDLCESCNRELIKWLSAEGASNMVDACINEREVL